MKQVFNSIRDWLWQHELSRFLIMGVVNTVVGYALFLMFNIFVHYALAYSLAYAVGIVFSYFMQTVWVFRVKPSWQSFLMFPSVYIVQYTLGVFLLAMLVEYLSVPETFAPLMVIIMSIPVTYVMTRFILKKPEVENTHSQ